MISQGSLSLNKTSGLFILNKTVNIIVYKTTIMIINFYFKPYNYQ